MQANLRETIEHAHQSQFLKFHQTLESLQMQRIPQFTLTGSGCRQKSIFMNLPIFRLALSIGFLTYQSYTYSIMITASHNPGADNGIKIGYTNGQIIPEEVFTLLQTLLNSEELFQKFVNERLQSLKEKMQSYKGQERFCFLGRDSRSSSPELSKIAKQTLEILGIKVIDFNICTTPELYSLSKEIIERFSTQLFSLSKINMEVEKQRYVKQTMRSFTQVWQILRQSKPGKRKILFDFSNGSGAVSYLQYKPYLDEYFDIIETNNTDFGNPNYECGAQYYHKNWHLVQNSQIFAMHDQCFFLDGDADRIIVKAKGCDIAFDGNHFIIVYTRMLSKILSKIQQSGIISKDESAGLLKIQAVGTVVTNMGVKMELKKQGINLITTNVGTSNLYKQAIGLKGWTVFFEPNGHGGIYVDEQSEWKVEGLLRQHSSNLELKLLVTIYKILKNNSRGYGLHNILVYYLCVAYLQMSQHEMSQLFTPMHEANALINLLPQLDCLYKNGAEKNNELTEPKQVCQLVEKISNKYPGYRIVLRKSETTKCLVRVNVQGLNSAICQDIIEEITNLVQEHNLKQK